MLTPKRENFSETKKSPQVVATKERRKVRVKAKNNKKEFLITT